MKRITLITLALALASPLNVLSAQGSHAVRLTSHLEPYGYFRTAALFDTRDSKAGTLDLFYYLPMDKTTNRQGKDIYSNPSIKGYSVNTLLGLNVKGYRFGNLQVSGRVEGDFYSMNGTDAVMRMREAWMDIAWTGLGYMENTVDVKIGQAWHPLSVDMPYCVNVETGSPFNPYNWSPQVMFNANLSRNWDITAGALYPVQFLPTGPLGPSEDYVKYSLIPELYAGLSFTGKHFRAKVGADVMSLKPRVKTLETDDVNYDVGTKVRDRLFMVSPFAYLQYSNSLFKVNAKTVLARGGDHLCLMGGYAVYDQTDWRDWKYTPLQSSVSFLSFSVGREWQLMCMAGYMKALGTARELPIDIVKDTANPNAIYYYENGFKNINQIFRVTPTLAWSLGKLTVAAEYDFTTVQYGNSSRLDSHALAYTNLHWILNHRVMGVVRFDF